MKKKIFTGICVLSILGVSLLTLTACGEKTETEIDFVKAMDSVVSAIIPEEDKTTSTGFTKKEYKIGDGTYTFYAPQYTGDMEDNIKVFYEYAYGDEAEYNDMIDGWCSKKYKRTISGYNGTSVNVVYDDCNPFGMIAGDFGEITSLSKHTSDTASDSTDAFNSLSELFATFMGDFEIPTNGTKFVPSIDSDALDNYTSFYNKAIELYNSSLVSFTKNISNNLSRSAVIGINQPYTMAFGTDVSLESIDFQTVIANLFGFDSVTNFMNYAQDLADTYAQHRTNITNSDTTNGALDNGCFYTSNGSFVFPIAVKNELSSPVVLTYVILDASGFVSVWVNDMTAALCATNFNSSYYTNGEINNKLYCKNALFVTKLKSLSEEKKDILKKYAKYNEYNTLRAQYDLVFGYAFNSLNNSIAVIKNNYKEGDKSDAINSFANKLKNYKNSIAEQSRDTARLNTYMENVRDAFGSLANNAIYNYKNSYAEFIRETIDLAQAGYDFINSEYSKLNYEELSLDIVDNYFTLIVENVGIKLFSDSEKSLAGTTNAEFEFISKTIPENYMDFMKVATIKQQKIFSKTLTEEKAKEIKEIENIYSVNNELNKKYLEKMDFKNIRFYEEWSLNKDEEVLFARVRDFYEKILTKWTGYFQDQMEESE